MDTERQRLAPEQRRSLLLDAALELIRSDGLASCTVEAVARSAGVTPQLVHKYLGKRADLLQALYERESASHRRDTEAALGEARGFEDIVRAFVRSNFDALSSSTALGRLRLAPEIVDLRARQELRESDRSADFLRAALTREFPMAKRVAIHALAMGSAASIAAGSMAWRGADRDDAIERTTRFVMAGVRALAGAADA